MDNIDLDKKILKKINLKPEQDINPFAKEEECHFGPLRSTPLQLTWKNVNVMAVGPTGMCGLSKKGEDKIILSKFIIINMN